MVPSETTRWRIVVRQLFLDRVCRCCGRWLVADCVEFATGARVAYQSRADACFPKTRAHTLGHRRRREASYRGSLWGCSKSCELNRRISAYRGPAASFLFLGKAGAAE